MKITNGQIIKFYQNLNTLLPIFFPPTVKYSIVNNFFILSQKAQVIGKIYQEAEGHYSQQDFKKIIIEFEHYINDVELQMIQLQQLNDHLLTLEEMQQLEFMIADEEVKTNMRLKYGVIYEHYLKLKNAFQDKTQVLPTKLNYKLQKNFLKLQECAAHIESEREKIAQEFGTWDENNSYYVIAPEKQNEALAKLQPLWEKEYEIEIVTILLTELPDDSTLTLAQMNAIMFMIEED